MAGWIVEGGGLQGGSGSEFQQVFQGRKIRDYSRIFTIFCSLTNVSIEYQANNRSRPCL